MVYTLVVPTFIVYLDRDGVHIDGLVVTDREQLLPRGVELDGPDLVAVLLEGVDALLGAHLPHLDGAITAARDKVLIVWTKVN